MLKSGFFVFISAIIIFPYISIAPAAEELFSPSTAEAFRDKAIDLYIDPNATAADARQALVFLNAINSLDKKSEYTLPDVIRLAWKFPSVNAHDQVKDLFSKYAINDDADLEVLRLSVQYLMEPMNSREDREQFFYSIVRNIGTRHKVLGSDLVTQLGLLAAERSDMQAAEYFLMQACNSNLYNKLAFQKLLEITPKQIAPVSYIRYWRLMVRANPYDLEAAYSFANSVYNAGLYEIAAPAYEYCADLSAQLHPNQPLSPAIYLPWVLSNFDETRNLKQCQIVANSIDKNGAFDLYLEAVAGNAALRLGNNDEGERILEAAAEKAVQLHSEGKLKAQELAWFYCFGKPDPEKALEWANKANASDPNSQRTGAILAYALVLNDQQEIAKPLAGNYKNNQIAALAMGMIQASVKDPNIDPNSTLAAIKSAIALDAGSLEAYRGIEMLAKKGSTYVPVYETASILKDLRSEFGDAIAIKFAPVQKLIASKLTASGNEFPYGGQLNASLGIINKGKEPLVVSDGCLFSGNIRIDAVVTGDLNERIPNLITQKVRLSEEIESERAFFIDLKLIQGRLKHLLLEHPQASVQIEFTAWFDPVTEPNGAVRNALPGIEPAHLSVSRNGVDVSGTYLQARLSTLTGGQPGQKIKSAQLFAGLLLEQRATAGSKPYKMTYIDPRLLRSGLARCLADQKWNLRVETMLMLDDVPLDLNLINAVSENFDVQQPWPVRMTALWLLGKGQDPGFIKVRDWTAKNDDDKSVLQMAAALGASVAPEKLAKAMAPDANEKLQLAVKEMSPPTKSSPLLLPSLPKAGAPESNQPAKSARVLPAEPAKTVSGSEPNKPATSAIAEPNKPKKAAEPNDVIEDILKS